MRQVAIVIPIYRCEITELEEISLSQLFSVLGKYDVCFLAPELIKEVTGETFRDRKVEYFNDKWFSDRLSYSRFCLNEELYERFIDYEYILIYQLDAFVFSDRLEHFCSLGYDYIGAPHSQMSATRINRLIPSDKGFYVGNGGFSLRRVSACIRALHYKEKIYKSTGEGYFDAAEDSFFTYCGMKPEIPFSIPSVEEAVFFSVQGDPDFQRLKTLLGNEIPFGTHAWGRDYCLPLIYPYMKPFLMDKPELLERVKDMSSIEEHRNKAICSFLRSRIEDRFSIEEIKDALNTIIDTDREYILWGYGVIGQWVERFFSRLGIRIIVIFDGNEKGEATTNLGNTVVYPDSQTAENATIVITSTQYEKEILQEIQTWNLPFIDYVMWHSIENRVLESVFHNNLEKAYYENYL